MGRVLAGWVLVLGACAAGACSGDATTSVDAGPDANTSLAAPALPGPPVLTPCPTGWRQVDDDDGDGTTCEPWPATGQATCADDEAHFPGEPGCVRVGAACPAGEWADGLPATNVLYVSLAAAPGGAGTMAAPFGTIAAATAVATTGTTIALGKGTFDETVQLPGGVTLYGACVAQTIVAASTYSMSAGSITIAGANATVRNLGVRGARVGVWVVGGGTSVQLQDVVIDGAAALGLAVAAGGVATADTIVVRDTAPRPGDMQYGRGVDVEAGGDVELVRAVVSGNHEVGVYATGMGSHILLTDVAIVDTLPIAQTNASGTGILVRDLAALEGTRVVVERSRATGVQSRATGTLVQLTDVVVRDTLGEVAGGTNGYGIAVQEGGAAVVTRALVERNRKSGLFVDGAGSGLTIADAVVRDTRAEAGTMSNGQGLQAEYGAVDLRRVVFARNTSSGVLCIYGALVTLVDVVVRDTAAEPATGDFGDGIAAGNGCAATVTRALVEGVRTTGVVVDGDDAAGNNQPASIVATDLTVRGTHSRLADGTFGRGLAAQRGGTLDVTRGAIEDNRDVGVFAYGALAAIHLTDVVVSDTAKQECDTAGTCTWNITTSLGAYEGATIDARRFRLQRSALMGVQLASGGTIDLHEGEVAENAIGANVQTVDFDVLRLQDGVTFRDNDVTLVADQLEVPDPVGPTGP